MHAHETSKDNTDIPLQQSTTRQMTGRIMQLTGAVRPELKLSLQLSETWDDHHPAGKGTVRLVSTMFGAWKPTAACPTPRLWILLCGHYRTFSWARSSLAEVANLSSADCYFIFAAIPLQIESVARTGSWSPVAGTLWQRLAKSIDDVHPLLDESMSVFNGRMAVAVLNRTDELDKRPGPAKAVLWHAAWALARVCAQQHNWGAIDPSTVVVRTRPDVVLRAPFAIDRFQRYARLGRYGRHLMLNQDIREGDHWWAQSDYFMITSFGAFEADIALPLELAGTRWRTQTRQAIEGFELYQRAYRNGWGNQPGSGDCLCLELPAVYEDAAARSSGISSGIVASRGNGIVAPCTNGSYVASCWPVLAESQLVVPIYNYPIGRDGHNPVVRAGLAGYLKGGGVILRDAPTDVQWPPPLVLGLPDQSSAAARTSNGTITSTGSRLIELTASVRCVCPVPPNGSLSWQQGQQGTLTPITTEARNRGELLFFKCRKGVELRPEEESDGAGDFQRPCVRPA